MAGADSRQIDGNGGAVLFQPQVTDGLCAVMPVVLELVRGFNVWEIDGRYTIPSSTSRLTYPYMFLYNQVILFNEMYFINLRRQMWG